MRPVKVAFDDGVNDAVIGEVQNGDQVIVDGQLRVIPGGKVFVGGQGGRNGGGQGGGPGGGKGGGKGPRGAGQKAGAPQNAG